ncbi:MAG: methylaspartate ammonia-lyase [Firmicutes bacterium]|nr:methylaspartate ammonia-lyase [Bacillota bacterium]
MKIVKLISAPVRTGFFFDDQLAIKNGAEPDGFTYQGMPQTRGFSRVRQAGEGVSVLLQLEDGFYAYGDCVAVQYSGVDGRDGLFLAAEAIPVINRVVKPRLEGRTVTTFREMAREADGLVDPATGRRLHTAIRYGLTQALLNAVAHARKKFMFEVVAEEYGLKPVTVPVPIFTQSGDERYLNADKMILKGVDALPHGLFNNVETKVGRQGEKLLAYADWLKQRIEALKPRADYRPVIHLDLYGTLGMAFQEDPVKITAYLTRLEQAVAPYPLRVEDPVVLRDKSSQIKLMTELTQRLAAQGSRVTLVADEWCNNLDDIKDFVLAGAAGMIQVKTPDLGGLNNTIEAVLFCKAHGIAPYLGGSCNETDRSARICAHIALATGPALIMAKPGMGVDEGLMIIYNEMSRMLAIRREAGRESRSCFSKPVMI